MLNLYNYRRIWVNLSQSCINPHINQPPSVSFSNSSMKLTGRAGAFSCGGRCFQQYPHFELSMHHWSWHFVLLVLLGLLQELCTSVPSSPMLTPSSLVALLLLCLSHISGGMNVIQGHNMGGLSGSYSFLDLQKSFSCAA